MNNIEEVTPSTDNARVQSTTTASNENPNGKDQNAFLTDPPIIDDDADELRRNLHTGPALYRPGELPRPRFVMLGQQGVGKVRLPIFLLLISHRSKNIFIRFAIINSIIIVQ